MDRRHIAYLIMLFLVVGAASLIAYSRYYSDKRKYDRARIRENDAYNKVMEAKDQHGA